MPRDPSKVHLLKDMKIQEVSLVPAGMNQHADVILTKGRLQKAFDPKEPRDERGRWTSWGTGDLVRGSKGAARQLVRALSDRAKAIGETVVGRTVSAVRTTKPTGAYPVRGGGVQFDFEHTLNGATGAKYLSSVQIRPEHVAGDTRTHRNLQRGLGLTHDILTRSNRQLQNPFSSTGTRFNWFNGRYQGPGGSLFGGGSGSGPSSPLAPVSTDQNAPGGIERRGPHGFPIWVANDTPAPWVGRVRSAAPPGAEPLANSSYRTAGGKAHFYNGHFVPNGRPDFQMAIAAAHDWLDANPGLGSAVRNSMRDTGDGRAYFTASGDYVPTAPRGVQTNFVNQYEARRTSKSALFPAAPVSAEAPATQYPHDLSGLTDTEVFNLKDRAERMAHTDEANRLNAEISRRATKGPSARSESSGYWPEVSTRKGAALFPNFAVATAGVTKSRDRGLDYVHRVAKSKIKRASSPTP